MTIDGTSVLLGGSISTSNTTYSSGSGITLTGTTFSANVSHFMKNGLNNRILTATGTDGMNAEGKLTFDGSTLSITGKTQVTGDIIPSANIAYDLGSSSKKFRDLYLSGATIHLGDTDLKSENNSFKVLHNGSTTLQKIRIEELEIGDDDNKVVLKKGSNNRLEIKTRDNNNNDTNNKIHFNDLDGNVTNSMLAGSISNDKLANNSMTIDGTSVPLGESISTSNTTYSAGNGIGLSNTTFSVASGDGLTHEASGLKITPGQTTITSVYNTSLKIGTASNQEYINFGTSNEVNTFVNNKERLSVTNSGVDITGDLTISGHVFGTGSITYQKVLNRSLSIIYLNTTFREIHSDLRIKVKINKSNITLGFYSGAFNANSRHVRYEIYDWNNPSKPHASDFLFMSYGTSRKAIHLHHTLTGLTPGNTYYFAWRFKTSSSNSFVYASNIYSHPVSYVIEHIDGIENSHGTFINNGDS